MFDFATKHFLVLSSLVIVISAAISMVVLSAYLSVFDWNLIWIIEYADLTKFFLIGAALISMFAMTLIYQTQDIYRWVVQQSKPWKFGVITALGVYFALTAVAAYIDFKHTGGARVWFYLYRAACPLLFVVLVYVTFRDHKHVLEGNWLVIGNLVAFSAFFLGVVGIAYGYYVKDVSTATDEVRTKTDTFSNAKIIMLLSHHVAFMVDKHVYVLPTSEIIRLVSKENEIPVTPH